MRTATRMQAIWVGICAVGSVAAAEGGEVHRFSLAEVAERNPGVAVLSGEGDAAVLQVRPTSDRRWVEIWEVGDGAAWEEATHLVCDIRHDNAFSGIVNIDFYRGRGDAPLETQGGGQDRSPRISPMIGVLPYLDTRLVFPLEHLDGQEIFLPRFPRQLKGTVSGRRLAKDEISRVALRFSPWMEGVFEPVFTIRGIYCTDGAPEPLPAVETQVVDRFGQWTARDWPGKVADEAELEALNRSLLDRARQAAYPEGWSRYGGWTERQFDATGFFRTHHDGSRWWLVDPDGYAFISVGVDCIGVNASGVVEGQEDLFEWLPEEVREQPAGRGRRGLRSVNFYQLNLERVFGEHWRSRWDEITIGLLREGAFNTVANWSDMAFARSSGVPYVLPMSGFPDTEIRLYRDFPDVFAEEYQENARRFARQLESYKDDPFLIGYFLRNEPHWAFGDNIIAFEMFGTSQASASKQAFVQWLVERYGGDAESFNQAWGLELASIAEVVGMTFADSPSPRATEDFRAFSEVLVERYVGIPCEEVEQVDPNHLNLGMRYAWISSELLYKAGERFDVFSINGYGNPGPPETAEIARRSGKPVMIGEFHFGAVDRGLPATGIQGALDQQARADAYRYYIEQGLARPELIGMHYFQWIDQPIFGRFDGENYNIGLVDICNRPYPELLEAATTTNRRMYQLATGAVTPTDKVIRRIPAIHY